MALAPKEVAVSLGEKAPYVGGGCTSCQWPGGLLSGVNSLQLLARQPAAQGFGELEDHGNLVAQTTAAVEAESRV